MSSNDKCSKTVLAGENGCRVTYCHDCRVAEIEVGSVSLRLKEDAFRNFASLIVAAADNLDGATLSESASLGQGIRHVH